MKRKVTEEQWKQAEVWKQQGMGASQIAKELGCSQGRVSQKLGKKREKTDVPQPQN